MRLVALTLRALNTPVIHGSPTTWNPADRASGTDPVLSSGDLAYGGDGTGWASVRSVSSKSSGKWKADCQFNGQPSGFTVIFGVATGSMTLSSFCGAGAGGWGMMAANSGNVRVFDEGSTVDYPPSLSDGEDGAVYVDIDAGKGWFWGTGKGFLGGGDPAAGTSPTFTFTAGTTLFLCGSAIFANHNGLLDAAASTSPAKTGFGGWIE